MYQLTIYLKTGFEEDQAGLLYEVLTEKYEGLLSLSYFNENARPRLLCLFSQTCQVDGFLNSLQKTDPVFSDLYLSYEEEDISEDQDWLDICHQKNPPFQAGAFWVYGSHIRKPAPDHLIPLCIDAVQAFGSGSHGTTKGCLELLTQLMEEEFKPSTILDIGTGSGILAIAAKKLFPKAEIIASDNDPACISATKNHAKENKTALTDIILSEGFENPNLKKSAPYDLIIANILPGVLTMLEKDIKSAIKPNGYILLSGIPAVREEEVCAAYHPDCYVRIGQIIHEDWISLLLHKL